MSRRTHKKSRNGCAECKQRHVKCDETLPTCVNCRTAERVCSFLHEHPVAPRPDSAAPEYPSPAATTNSAAVESPFCQQYQQPSQQYVVNLEHMDLLCHFYAETSKDFQSSPSSTQNALELFRQYISSAPYLFHEVLAIAALHISLLRIPQQEYYRAYASGLQTQALSLFNSSVADINELNCAPAFIFSSLIGVHTLCDTLRYRPHEPATFLDRFIKFCTLHRGVRIVAGTSWDILRQTDHLKPYLAVAERTIAAPGTECSPLLHMVDEADVGCKSREIYESAIKHLQWAFDMDRHAQTRSESKQMLFAWTVIVPPEYVDLLMQRRAEALIVLAYYGVILFRHRSLWVVGDGGEFLIRAISTSLGSYWERWLAWPNAEVDAVTCTGD